MWGLSQTRIAPLAFMFLFIIVTAAYTWNGGNEKQAARQNEWAPGSFRASVNRRAVFLIDRYCGLKLLLLAGLNPPVLFFFFKELLSFILNERMKQQQEGVLFISAHQP